MPSFGVNPRAEKGALQYSDIRKGLEMVVIRGGRYYHEHLVVVSGPHSETAPLTKGQKSGITSAPRLTRYWLVARSKGKAADTEISNVGDGASRTASERSLVDLGFCPDNEGNWSSHYCVPLTGYVPSDHE